MQQSMHPLALRTRRVHTLSLMIMIALVSLLAACGDSDPATVTKPKTDPDVGHQDVDETVECSDAELLCDGRCIDPNTSAANCGQCGQSCEAPEVCSEGGCTLACPASQTACDGGCFDLNASPTHCGSCHSACSEGEVCSQGSCSFSCPGDLSDCSGSCRDLQSDQSNCGGCGISCEAGEVCSQGACALSCAGDLTDCSGSCHNLQNDRANCGGCGVSCGAGEVCSQGSCEVSCGDGLNQCGGTCRDLTSDRNNCGGCDTVCGAGEVCSQGGCEVSCGGGLNQCGDTCRDLTNDRSHCGGCDIQCGAGEVCSDGSCEVSCGGGLEECQGTCRDFDTDRNHCGGCGVSCGAGEVCSQRSCELSCGGGLTECDGTCRDLDNDRNHCGGCGTTCGAGEVCTDGNCEVSCAGGLSVCDGTCRDLDTDRNHCGQCGVTCSDGESCIDGSCEVSCGAGQTDCSGSCRDLQTDLNNCGGCGAACGAGEVCSQGQCQLSCAGSLVDCGGSCVQTAFDPNHCGGCDIACDVPTNAHASCAQSICGFVCQSGWGNCYGLEDGCETSLTSDRDHCGACGVQCPNRPNSAPLCTNGSCGFACLSGFDNCDNDPETGCLDLSNDDQNCGGCGVVCGQNERCSEGGCVALLGSGTLNDPYESVGLEVSCQAYLNAFPQLATDGFYRIDPPNLSPLVVHCDMTVDGGGWTRCLEFVNTSAEDVNNNTWFDACVDWTMANWTSNQLMVRLRDTQGNVAYQATGSRNAEWTYDHITSTIDPGSQFHSPNHNRLVTLSQNDDKLMITGRYSSNGGCGGSIGDGYGVIVYPTSPNYYHNPKMYVMPYRGGVSGSVRSFSGWTTSNEITYSPSSFSSCSSTPNYLGRFEFYLR